MNIRLSTYVSTFGVLSILWMVSWPMVWPAAALADEPLQKQPDAQAAKASADAKPNYTPEQQQQLDRAHELFTQASKLNDQGKYGDAIPLIVDGLKLREAVVGPDHQSVANICSNLGVQYQRTGRYADALPPFQRALKIDEKVLGSKHSFVAIDLNNLASLYTAQGNYTEALPLYQRALRIDEQLYGPDHPDVATTLNNLAHLYAAQGNFAEAIPLFQRAIKIREKIQGPEHPDLATNLSNLAQLYETQANYAEARPLCQRALKIYEKALGPEHPLVAPALDNLAVVYEGMGDYAASLPLKQRALTIVENAYGPEHPNVATALNNLASLYMAQGNYAEAQPLLQRALKIDEKALGPEHPEVATNLNNLATLYEEQGNYAEALPLYQRSLKIAEKSLGPDHPEVATNLNCLAALYQDQGNYAEALPLYQRSLKIAEKSLGPDHPHVASTLNNLAELYRAQGHYSEALPLYQRALKIDEKALGPDHPDVATALNNLAVVYESLGDYAASLSLKQRALRIYEKALGPDHPLVAGSLNNLAEFYQSQRNYTEALPLFQRALKIKEKALGPDHPDVAHSLDNLAALQSASGQWPQASHNNDQARRIIRRHVARILPSLSPKEQASFLQVNDQGPFHGSLSFGLERRSDPETVALSAGWLLNGKGVAQEALAQNVQLARDSSDPNTAATAKQLLQVRQQLAALFYVLPKPDQEQARRSQLDQLQRQEEDLARQIAQAHGEAFQADPWVDVAAVRKAIPQGTVLVDIACFQTFNFQAKSQEKKWQSTRYAAWLVPAEGQGEIQIIDLGEADPIDKLVVLARSEINRKGQVRTSSRQQQQAAQQSQNKPVDQSATRGLDLEDNGQSNGGALQRLAQLIFEPLQSHLGDATRLIISPDASLWLIPWGALPLADGQYAIEKYQISYTISGRELVKGPAGNLRPAAPALFANPDYDLPPVDMARATNAALVRIGSDNQPLAMTREVSRSASGAFHASRLPGTADEAKAIEPQLKAYCHVKPVAFLDREAVEGAFKALKRPQVLVLSTHGFFLPDQEVKHDDKETRGLTASADGKKRAIALTTEGKPLENPLLRCGLLLAGCNQSQQVDPASAPGVTETAATTNNAVDDGILTGMEIVGTDLRGTELVVLSACETGMGQVRNGEGVAGLRQAFQLAGAQAVVATLWQIPDRETSHIMGDFFTNLAGGQSKTDALRNAQLSAIRASRSTTGDSPPFYWAAFTLTGE